MPTIPRPSIPRHGSVSSLHIALHGVVIVLAALTDARADDVVPPSGLPVLWLDTTEAAAIDSRERYVPGRIRLDVAGCTDPFDRVCRPLPTTGTRVRGRGNTTWDYAKKPYRLRLDEPADILGMGMDRDWVLLADYIDPTGLRNALAFELGRRLGLPATPQARHVNLVVNGRHAGLYLLTEHTETGPDRVVTDPLTGFLAEFDDYPQPGEEIFSTAVLDLPLKIRAPDLESLTGAARSAAVERVRGAFERLERTVSSPEGPGDYATQIDVPRLVDWFLVHEITHNYEPLHPKSCFFHRGADGRIVAGPLWDFDYAYDYEAPADEVLGLREALWFPHLFRDPAFRAAVKERWSVIKVEHVETLPAYLDRLAAGIEGAVRHDRVLFPTDEEARFPADSVRLRAWLVDRIVALDAAIGEL